MININNIAKKIADSLQEDNTENEFKRKISQLNIYDDEPRLLSNNSYYLNVTIEDFALSDGKWCYSATFNEEEVYYEIIKEGGECIGGWDEPIYGDAIEYEGVNHAFSLNDVDNEKINNIIEIEIEDENGKASKPKFTDLSMQDRYLILKQYEEALDDNILQGYLDDNIDAILQYEKEKDMPDEYPW